MSSSDQDKDKYKRSQTDAMREAIEASARGTDFGATAMRKDLDETSTDDTDHPSPDKLVEKTRTDSASYNITHTTDITDFQEASQVPEELLADAAVFEKRFDLQDRLGKGATGLVYAMRDHSLDRTVAVKFLHRRREGKTGIAGHFIHEARVTATLEHPNIMPVHDIGQTAKGQLFFSMKRISGGSLGGAIRAVHEGRPPPEEFRTFDGRVRIFLKVCDALAYAHHRGYIHQDVKPDNVMLGEFGEVLLVDWGSALYKRPDGSTEGLGIYGTPAYMSPEQARREAVDERSDIYCLGATLFQALLLRHPTWATEAELFWEKKRRGVVDAPTDAERRRAPAALIDIALKALAADPAARYQSVTAMAGDLKRWQAGQAVSAHHESPVEKFARWYRLNKRLFWISSALTLLVLGVAALFFREKIQELVTWRPYFRETFSYNSTAELAERWSACGARDWYTVTPQPFQDSGSWRVARGGLEATNRDGFDNIAFRGPVPGDMRVEWDVTPLLHSSNLNAFIGGPNRREGFMFHVAGFGDPRRCAMTGMGSDEILAETRLAAPFKVDRSYHLRMELEGRNVRLFLDGRRLINYRSVDELRGAGHQTFGFENNSGNRIRITNVVIYYHPDRFFEQGYYADALRQYRELVSVYPRKDVGRVAQFKTARCLARMDSSAEALAALQRFERELPRHELVPVVILEQARVYERSHDTAAAEGCYRRLGQRFPGHPALRQLIAEITSSRNEVLRRITFTTWFYDTTDDGTGAQWTLGEAARLIELARAFGVPVEENFFLSNAVKELVNRSICTADDIIKRFPTVHSMQAVALNLCDQAEQVVDRFGADTSRAVRSEVAGALNTLGHYQQVLDNYVDQRPPTALALVRLGRYDAAVTLFPEQADRYAEALAKAGRFDQLLRECPGNAIATVPVSGALGVVDSLLKRPELDYGAVATLLVGPAGRPDSALQVMQAHGGPATTALFATQWEAMAGVGRADEVLRRFDRVPVMSDVVADALVYLGRSQDVLARFPRMDKLVVRALIERGDLDGVASRCPRLVVGRVNVAWYQGRQEELLTAFPRRDSLCAAVLLSLGRNEEVLRRYPHIRGCCAEAQLALGNLNEVVARYPDQRGVCARAVYAKGLFADALRDYPESRPEYARRLLALGRYEEVVQLFPDQLYLYSVALSYLRRYSEIPLASGLLRPAVRDRVDLRCLRGLQTWMNGQPRVADSLLAAPQVCYYVWWEHHFSRFLLQPILHGLAGDTATLARGCRRLMEEQRFVYGQQLWYEAGYLIGKVSDADFLQQPVRFDAERRLRLLRAVRAELLGRPGEALKDYAAAAEWPERMTTDDLTLRNPFRTATVRQFIAWRRGLASGQSDWSVPRP
jgi:tetratricopeptide (TPR) repeat protein